jgi:hypothetical protein
MDVRVLALPLGLLGLGQILFSHGDNSPREVGHLLKRRLAARLRRVRRFHCRILTFGWLAQCLSPTTMMTQSCLLRMAGSSFSIIGISLSIRPDSAPVSMPISFIVRANAEANVSPFLFPAVNTATTPRVTPTWTCAAPWLKSAGIPASFNARRICRASETVSNVSGSAPTETRDPLKANIARTSERYCCSVIRRGAFNRSNSREASAALAFAWAASRPALASSRLRYASLVLPIHTMSTVATTPTSKLPMRAKLAMSYMRDASSGDGHIRMPPWFPLSAIAIVLIAGVFGLIVSGRNAFRKGK